MNSKAVAGCLILGGLWLTGSLVHGATLRVNTTGTETPPYDNWENAARSIQTAVLAAGDEDDVIVSNGTYTLTGPIVVTNGVTVHSVNGAAVTIVDGNDLTRCFYLSHSNALVDGFTVTRGRDPAAGAGVYILSRGTVRNCVVTNNHVTRDWGFSAAGIVLDGGGTVENSLIAGNTHLSPSYGSTWGGGIFCSGGGMVNNCRIIGNRSGYNGAGVLVFYGGTIRNCLLTGNQAFNDGGGIFLWKGGEVENCTISGNNAYRGGGIKTVVDTGGSRPQIRNTIIYGNSASSQCADMDDRDNYGGATYSNNCASANSSCVPMPGSGNISTDPKFVGGSFWLSTNSSCVNAGVILPWMTGALDLAGNPRIVGGLVDMGAYETTSILDQTISIWSAIEITWPSSSNVSYQVQSTTNLSTSNWINLGNPIIGNGSVMSVFDSARSKNANFYRLIAH